MAASMFAVGSAYALAVAAADEDSRVRAELVRFGCLVGLAGLALGAVSFAWYSATERVALLMIASSPWPRRG